mmetsp:Transcript_79935/g.222708  ORF Transcript_79935/g.222708 Transcript_79935/m.222708 type:complete len:991 (+) Transcript_79935:55-3027(+)
MTDHPDFIRFGSRSLFDADPLPEVSAEHCRRNAADDNSEDWKRWGPYVSERQWGTCREDYGLDGNSWAYLPFQHAHQVAYRWGEDGIAGFCDIDQHLCISLAMWNGRDPILKERIFGLANPEGNHGEDSKDMYYYLDATPTHSYLKMLYKYPQEVFPYDEIRRKSADLRAEDPEFELLDTGIFDADRYFDVYVEYARGEGVDDILMRIVAYNRSSEAADLHVLPQAVFRNTWSWTEAEVERPSMKRAGDGCRVDLDHPTMGKYFMYSDGAPEILLCENETNKAALEGDDCGLTPYDFKGDPPPKEPVVETQAGVAVPAETEGDATRPQAEDAEAAAGGGASAAKADGAAAAAKRRPLYQATGRSSKGPFKDAVHRYVIKNDPSAAKASLGTKAAYHTRHSVPGGGHVTVRLRLAKQCLENAFADFDATMATRLQEADDFYAISQREIMRVEHRRIQRQALAGMIWTKQFYYFDLHAWHEGDKGCAELPPERHPAPRNTDWDHMLNKDIISMPDKWEFPWYATWDLAFHCLPLALVDANFAKGQLLLMTREWYMHPNGQLPAFEWNFSDVNPPVHAWASWRVFQMDRKAKDGEGDYDFLEEVFHKLMINFTWWVNRKDAEGRNVFQGGFLGLDNIGVFDRGGELPTGGFINQSDGTSWMAFYSLNLMRIALELALKKPVYENIASKFFEHFLHIARAMVRQDSSVTLWDEEDCFYYDVLTLPEGKRVPLKVRSMVGLIPLFAVEVLEPSILEQLPRFASRVQWLFDNRPDLAELVSMFTVPGHGERRLLSLLRSTRLKAMLNRMLDPEEFLSDYGVRALSRYHLEHPYVLEHEGQRYEIGYEPAEASVKIMGGNSNWRGPIWFPMNYLIIESLQKFHQYYGPEYLVEFPARSGNQMSILAVADALSERLISIFEPKQGGEGRPAMCLHPKMATDPNFKDNILFYEHFHGDTGRGVGASHQTGWTGLVAKLIQARASYVAGPGGEMERQVSY